MRFTSPTDALVLKRASLGPAGYALRAARMRGRVPPGISLTRGGSTGRLQGLGDAAVNTAATKVAAVGTQAGVTAWTAASAGAWAGPIGIAAGAIVGLVIGKILNRHYLNVGQANAVADASLQAFQQYRQIAGQIPGRQLGVDALNAIWNGAIYAGYFPGNNPQLCFHEGCLKYRGQPAWVWGVLHDGANNPFTFASAWAKMQAARAAAAAPAVYSPSGPSAGSAVFAAPAGVRSVTARYGVGSQYGIAYYAPTSRFSYGLRGLGSLGDVQAGVPDAVTLIDQYFIPANRNDRPPWAVPQNAVEHQLLYDAADAWLAVHGDSNSTPFVAVPTTQAPGTGVITAADATQGGIPPVGPGPGGSGLTVGVAPVGSGSTYDFVPVTNPQTGQTSYQIQPASGYQIRPSFGPAAPAGPTVATAGLSNLPPWGYWLVAAGIVLAMSRPEHSPSAIAASRVRRAAARVHRRRTVA